MYKIGLSTCAKILCEDLFKQYHESGISMMEISLDPEEYANLNCQQIQKWAKEYDIKLWSYHLPFSPFTEIDISNKDICKKTISYFEELIKKGSDIGIDKFIVHPSGEPISDEERDGRMNCAKESLVRLSEIAKRNGAVICVENLPRSCIGKNSDEILELVSVDENLEVCFDTNHLLAENPVDFIHKIGKKIVTTHVSDYDFVNERHWLPGEGKTDWQAILNALDEIGYNGAWLYEVSFAAPRTIVRDRDLNCFDFVKNAKELFENKKITVISRHVENL